MRERRKAVAALVAWIALMAYGFLIAELPSSSLLLLPMNLSVAALLVWAARRSGIGWDELGLSSERIRQGFRWGIPLALITAAIIIVAATLNPDSFRCGDTRVVTFGTTLLFWHLLIRIPFATALSEEVIFRGVLFAWLRRAMGTLAAVAISGMMFSLWHVAPTLALVDALGQRAGCPGQIASLTITLATTAAAGIIFAILRILGHGLLAPVLLHTTFNAVGLAATYVALAPPR
jgi:membrane protease YdiL (CAAX protease family)